ncbi:hypothetical protein GGX14DRAFT_398528 [Mycena pura]|uniref:Uncharacterized protein n=1 Tax=Mycena pura TaxID=153505 RepID=A0AAD6Y6B1_9AGAR|nr:hypothetical protein GGX14DRAFT_398528 [Mycena pura]
MSQVFIGVHIPMSMTPCLSSLNNPPRWSLPTTPDTAGHLKVEMMECTPRSRCHGMHPVHKGQQKGGMREQAEKGLKELIKAALEEDSDDDNKPVDLGNAPGNAPPPMCFPSPPWTILVRRHGASQRQGGSDAGRRASKWTPRGVVQNGSGGGQQNWAPACGRAVVVVVRGVARRGIPGRRCNAAAATGETSGGGAAQVLQRGSAVAARRRERVSKARARCPVSMRRRRVARRCNAAAAAGDSTAGGVVRQLTPRTLPQAHCTGNGRRKRAPAVPRCSRGPPRAALPRQNILSDRHKHEFFAERSLSCGLYPK